MQVAREITSEWLEMNFDKHPVSSSQTIPQCNIRTTSLQNVFGVDNLVDSTNGSARNFAQRPLRYFSFFSNTTSMFIWTKSSPMNISSYENGTAAEACFCFVIAVILTKLSRLNIVSFAHSGIAQIRRHLTTATTRLQALLTRVRKPRFLMRTDPLFSTKSGSLLRARSIHESF